MALPTCGTINTTGCSDCGVNPYNPGPISQPSNPNPATYKFEFDSIYKFVLLIPNREFRLRSPENRSFRCTVVCLRRSAYLSLMQADFRSKLKHETRDDGETSGNTLALPVPRPQKERSCLQTRQNSESVPLLERRREQESIG